MLGKLISTSSEKPRALKIKQINVGLSPISFGVLFVFVLNNMSEQGQFIPAISPSILRSEPRTMKPDWVLDHCGPQFPLL